MADFRKLYLALAASALILSFAGTASAQLTCNASATPLTARVEGQREPLGDVRLDCSGGTPTAAAAAIPQVNITVTLSQPSAVRLYGAAAGGTATDALLLVDEPAPGAQNICAAGNACGFNAPDGLGGGGGLGQTTYTAAVGRFNGFQGVQTGPQTIQFLGVPLNAPGGAVGVTPLVIRITNLRGVISGTVPVTATISTSVGIPINNSSVVVAYPQQGLVVLPLTNGINFLQCVSATGSSSFVVNFKEGFATAARTRVIYAGGAVSNLQGTPGQNNNTESMFIPFQAGAASSAATLVPAANFGLADFGTRYQITLSGVPAGVTTVAFPLTLTTPTGTLHLITSSIALYGAPGVLPLATGTSTINGVPAAVTDYVAGANTAQAVTVPASGTVSAVYEVGPSLVVPPVYGDAPDPFSVQTWNVPVGITFAFSAGPPSTPTTTAVSPQVTVTYAPGPEAGTQSVAPSLVPAFSQTSTPQNTFTISSCSTTLLYPFITNQANFDTGIAISATGKDPFGIYPLAGPNKTNNGGQGGSCTLYMYGNVLGVPFTPPTTGTLPSITVAPGTSGTNLVSVINAGFQGYMFAQCNFQYAHGYAFIADGFGATARGASHGYLALIIPDPNQNSRAAQPFTVFGGATGEQLGY